MGYTPSFTPQYENGWEDLPSETSPITAEALNAYDDAIENIEEYLEENEIVDANTNLAEEYDPEEGTYAVDDYCIHDNVLYKCLTAVSEPEDFDEEKWEAVLVTDVMGSGSGGSSTLSGLDDVNLSSPTNGQVLKYDSETNKWKNADESGGGGSANIWTGTQAEYEAQASQIADGTLVNITDDEQEVVEGGTIYSEDEQVIGLWTDNRPLYQKTLHFQNVSLSSGRTIVATTSQLSSLSIDNVVKEIGGFITFNSGANVINVPYAVGSTSFVTAYYDSSYGICMQRGGNALATNDISLTITYTKSTDAPLDAVVGKKTMYIANSDCYSTEEKEVGVFADGKPLYQKTIYTSGGNLTSGQIVISNDLANIEHIASWKCVTHDVTHDRDYCLNHNRFDATEDVKFQTYVSSDNTVALVILVSKTTFMTSIGDTWITLQYTKTTDTAGSGQYTPASGKAVHYSTDEQVIGTWVDGSTLYRRVVPFTSARTNVQTNTWTELPEVDASNILQVINSVIINYSAETPNYRVNIPCMCSTNRDAFNQHLAFAHLRPTAVSFPVGNMIIIEYTKITD